MFSSWLTAFPNLQYLKLLYQNIKTVQQFKLLPSKPLTLTRIRQNASSILCAKNCTPTIALNVDSELWKIFHLTSYPSLKVNTKNIKTVQLLYQNIRTVQQFKQLLSKPLTLTWRIYQNASSIPCAKTIPPTVTLYISSELWKTFHLASYPYLNHCGAELDGGT